VTGGTVSGQDLRSAVDDAMAAQASAAALGGTALGNFTGGSLAAGVYEADSFDLNKTTLTITGGASDRFILNVNGEFDFHQARSCCRAGSPPTTSCSTSSAPETP
jgi:Ice-binding-like